MDENIKEKEEIINEFRGLVDSLNAAIEKFRSATGKLQSEMEIKLRGIENSDDEAEEEIVRVLDKALAKLDEE